METANEDFGLKDTNESKTHTVETHDSEKSEYCAVHGCKVGVSESIMNSDDINGNQYVETEFPSAIMVCQPSDTSE